ncbi:MAG: hypothetical protein WAN23_11460, partial [Candidatus Acidiferrales bacterium]
PASSVALGFGLGIRERSAAKERRQKTLAGGFVPHFEAKGFVTAASNPQLTSAGRSRRRRNLEYRHW